MYSHPYTHQNQGQHGEDVVERVSEHRPPGKGHRLGHKWTRETVAICLFQVFSTFVFNVIIIKNG